MMKQLWTAGFTTLALGAGLFAADWPQWRGANRDGISTEKGLMDKWPEGGPKLTWTFKDAGTGYGSLAVAKGSIYLLGGEDGEKGSNEFCIALDEKTGKQKWKTPLGTSDGKYNTGWGAGPRSTPTVDGDHLYVLGGMGDLVCLKADSGKVVWQKNLVKDFGGGIPTWGYSESPTIDSDRLIVTPGGQKGAVVALDKKTGKTIWTCGELKDGAGYSSFVIAEIHGIRQYVTQTMANLVGIDAKTGKLLWKASGLDRKVAVIPTPIVIGTKVFVSAGYNAGSEFVEIIKEGETLSAKKIYTSKTMVNHHGGLIKVGDNIYGYSDKGSWMCLDFTQDTDPVWTENKALKKGCLTCADGKLFLQGEDKGTCVMIEATPKGFKELGRVEMPEKSKIPKRSGKFWSHPVIANGKLYLRDYDLVFCFDIKQKPD